eukprot:2061061-Lingulodinium_polyedra.AAC.1
MRSSIAECVTCETQIRAAEFAIWSEEEKKKQDPNYAEKWKVQKDLKMANKGKAYAATSSHIQQTNKEIREEQE